MKIDNFDHLVLLIGTNPLPNFVVADYFLQENPKLRTIWLLHSEENPPYQAGTLDFAENLEKLLWKRRLEETNRKVDFQKVPLSDVSGAQIIKQEIDKYLVSKIKKGEIIHLNYTGGTKSMSTHAYWVVREKFGQISTFSYLDGRNFRLISDENGVLEDDLREHVVVTVKELVELHGFERKNETSKPFFKEAVYNFGTLIENGEINKFYDKDNGYNRNMFLDEKGLIPKKPPKQLTGFSPGEQFLYINAAILEEYRLFSKDDDLFWDIDKDKFKATIKFLDGLWLEDYVYYAIKPICDKEKSITIDHDWKIRKPNWKENDFQLDVLLLKGYQLTGISCTTDDKKGLCKSKGFEIIHRTRQIGGGEARSVLITRANPTLKNKLQEELEHETGGLLGNILVLGEKDLKKERLIKEIRNFVLE